MSFNTTNESFEDKKDRSLKIIYLLSKKYPDAKIMLNYKNNWELLVAVILSAQCTDKMVNKVTENLFKKYKRVGDFAKLSQEELEKDIYKTGFYRHKAKNIISGANLILEKWSGEVPNTMGELTSLPGVARKTANVVLGNAFGIVEGIAVDTHVKRLSQRLGFTKQNNPEKIEKDLMKLISKKYWFKITYLLIEHGRAICKASNPQCKICFLSNLCPSSSH